MIQLSNVTLSPDTDFQNLVAIVARLTGFPQKEIGPCRLLKRSVDARKKPDVVFNCTIGFTMQQPEAKWVKRSHWKHTALVSAPGSVLTVAQVQKPVLPPVVVGSGPAGLFAALILAKAGCCPILLERGEGVEQRTQTVDKFWRTGILNPESNVQFGEGGAGTFSDGKLNTGTKDPRNRFVLETFVEHGAPEEILFEAKPHVGTDRLVAVVRSMRNKIRSLGGQVLFSHRLVDITTKQGSVRSITVMTPDGEITIPCTQLILALGHSARDTMEMLYQKGLAMEQKPFSLGVRIEHPQEMINRSQYAERWSVPPLPAAEYKLSTHLPNGRGVYTFCMCPGGEVVASTSLPGHLCTNGMSRFARNGVNANSALLVGVSPADFGTDHPLGGMKLQETIEKAAFISGGEHYHAPVQLVGDFLKGQNSRCFGQVAPTYQPGVTFTPLTSYLPDFVTHSLQQALPILGQKIKGFDRPDALLTGPETRSSSPVRIVRNQWGQATVGGIYPCGEGAGYAGGITSAAADGIRVGLWVLEQLQEK